MDQTSIKESLRDFQSVWGRVAGPAAGAPAPGREIPGEAERLRAFLLSASNAAALYTALAHRFRGAAPVLARLAAQERSQLHTLRLEYYLLTGEMFTHDTQPPAPEGLLGQLRRAWQAEGRSEQSYLRAAEVSPLGALYRAHAQNERRHAQALRELIARGLQ